MEIEFITKKDLEDFRQQLLSSLAEMLNRKGEPEKQYLRSKDVRRLLGNISNGTLQNLRVKRLLNPSKIEGVFYYKLSEVQALLNAGSGI